MSFKTRSTPIERCLAFNYFIILFFILFYFACISFHVIFLFRLHFIFIPFYSFFFIFSFSYLFLSFFHVIFTLSFLYFERFTPYFERFCVRFPTFLESNWPGIKWYFTPGKSLTRPPRNITTEYSWRVWPSPGI